MKIICVIPAYNEEKTIVKVINEVKRYVDETVVVDDGSLDQTYNLAKMQGAAVLRHIINRGQGAALKTGTEYALNNGADIIVHFDADGQFLADDISNVVKPLKTGDAEVVFGSRFLKGGGVNSQMPFFKKNIIMPLAKLANKIFLGIEMTDPQSGFRAMSACAAGKISWRQDRMAHCSEILFEATRAGLKIKEVPITIIYNHFGQRFSGGLKILKDLFLARLIN